jgi:hypothetical protein
VFTHFPKSPLVSIIVGARHVIAALLAVEFAFALSQPPAANRTKQHRFALAIKVRFGRRVLLGIFVHR